MSLGLDPNATTPERIRRNWQRLVEFGPLATVPMTAPLSLNGTTLTLSLSPTGGLQVTSGSLTLKLDTNPGLALASTGLSVKLNPAGAIETGASGIAVAVDNVTVAISSNKIQIKDGGVSLTQLGALTTKGDLLGYSTTHARLAVGTNGQVLTADSTQATGVKWANPAGVTTLTLTAPSILSVSGSPLSGAGTIGLSLANQSANLVFAGPSSGAAAAPTFRSVVAADLPGGDWVTGTQTTSVLSTAFTLAAASNGVWQDTGLTLVLPSAGTYLVLATAHNTITSTTVNEHLALRLFNVTTNAAVANSEVAGAWVATTGAFYEEQTPIHTIINATASGTLRLEALYIGTSPIAIIKSIAEGRTKMTYVRLK